MEGNLLTSAERDKCILLLNTFMQACNNVEADAIECVINYLKLGGEITPFVQKHIDNAKEFISTWVSSVNTSPTHSPTVKRKYTKRNPSPELNIESPYTIRIYCEGTSTNIGTEQARSGYGVFVHITTDKDVLTREISELLSPDEHQSNQRAELRALYKGILISNELMNEFPGYNIQLVVTSQYSYNCVNVWSNKWKLKEWKGNIQNVDIIRNMIDTLQVECKLISKKDAPPGFFQARLLATRATSSRILP